MQPQINLLSQQETKKILAALRENYGISFFPKNSKLAMRGKEKIFLFTGNLDEKQISQIQKITMIEGLGVYFAKLDDQENIRLTIEGVQIFQNQITKNIVELNSASQVEEWMMGRELLWEDLRSKEANSFNSINSPLMGGRTTSRLGSLRDGGGVGSRVTLTKPHGFVVIKFKDDFLGCGKSSAEKITNFIPKSRRLKEKS